MRRFALVAGVVVAVGLGGVSPAVAAAPGVNRFTISESFTDPDFCGTGQAVDVSILLKGTEFLAPNQPVDYRNVIQGNEVYTNPENGATVIRHVAGPFSATVISGDPAGVHTEELTVIGQGQMLRSADGGVLAQNAGYLVLHQVVNGDEVISSEVVVARGPHPNAESGFTLFCDVTTEALGLS